jgi:hypothetical protein
VRNKRVRNPERKENKASRTSGFIDIAKERRLVEIIRNMKI